MPDRNLRYLLLLPRLLQHLPYLLLPLHLLQHLSLLPLPEQRYLLKNFRIRLDRHRALDGMAVLQRIM